jgi:hypothetical protein
MTHFLYKIIFILALMLLFGDINLLYALCESDLNPEKTEKNSFSEITSPAFGFALFMFVIVLYIGLNNQNIEYSSEVLARGLYGIIDPGLLSPDDFDKPSFFADTPISTTSIPSTSTNYSSINGNTPYVRKDFFF